MKQMKKILSVLLALCLVLALLPGMALAAAPLPFNDVSSTDPYYEAVRYVYEHGIMNGTGDGTAFSPAVSTGRGMIVTILHRMDGELAVSGGTTFTDVAADAWYAKAAAWSSTFGVVNGYGDGSGRFAPDDSITREQIASILFRFTQYMCFNTNSYGDLNFSDTDQISSYAWQAMSWAVGNDLLPGTEGGKLSPQGAVPRGDAAIILMRYCQKFFPEAPAYETKTSTQTVSADRGLGRVSATLTGGADAGGAALPDYAGNINANGYARWSPDGSIYELRVSPNFYRTFESSDRTEVYTAANYASLKLVITPFTGESFTGTPTATATTRNYETDEQSEVAVSAALEGGNIVLTCENPVLKQFTNLSVEVALGEKTQSFNVNVDAQIYENTMREIETETWAETVAALASGEYDYILYVGQEDVTLTTPLTIEAGRNLIFMTASFTIGSGGVLTMNGERDSSSYVNMEHGSLTVANGGTLTSVSKDSYSDIYAVGGVTVAAGGKVEVAADASLSLNCAGGDMTVEDGATVSNLGSLYVSLNGGKGTIAGTITTGQEAADSYAWTYLSLYGGFTVAESGSITAKGPSGSVSFNGGLVNNGSISGNNIYLDGPVENNGTITLTESGYMTLSNPGYSVRNAGTICLENGGYVNVSSTLLVNTGSITGSGTLSLSSNSQAKDYDTGIRALVSSSYTPDNYQRRLFAKDPDATAELITFTAELSNRDGGTCTLEISDY